MKQRGLPAIRCDVWGPGAPDANCGHVRGRGENRVAREGSDDGKESPHYPRPYKGNLDPSDPGNHGGVGAPGPWH